ncbi:calcium-independent phospholipase A2-gamma [Pelomyxa schiedti]|nr:calcium-independent phospholipase A2-gamma [Pelomyxa schiedti]
MMDRIIESHVASFIDYLEQPDCKFFDQVDEIEHELLNDSQNCLENETHLMRRSRIRLKVTTMLTQDRFHSFSRDVVALFEKQCEGIFNTHHQLAALSTDFSFTKLGIYAGSGIDGNNPWNVKVRLVLSSYRALLSQVPQVHYEPLMIPNMTMAVISRDTTLKIVKDVVPKLKLKMKETMKSFCDNYINELRAQISFLCECKSARQESTTWSEEKLLGTGVCLLSLHYELQPQVLEVGPDGTRGVLKDYLLSPLQPVTSTVTVTNVDLTHTSKDQTAEIHKIIMTQWALNHGSILPLQYLRISDGMTHISLVFPAVAHTWQSFRAQSKQLPYHCLTRVQQVITLCNVITFLHRHGITLKIFVPDNVFINASGEAFFNYFQCSFNPSNDAALYAAPELSSNTSDYRVDFYSLGKACIAIEELGQTVYSPGSEPHSRYYKLLHEMSHQEPPRRPEMETVIDSLEEIARQLSLVLPESKYNILCLDGGGIRGLVEIEVLMELERRTGKKIWDIFTLICGTSTGGILAIALGLLKIDLHILHSFYMELGPRLFGSSWYKKFVNWATTGGCYSSSMLQNLLLTMVPPHRTWSQCSSTFPKVCVTSTRIGQGRPETVLFRSYQRPDTAQSRSSPPGDLTLLDGALATSAAPSYFSPKLIGGVQYIDGGVGANNPANEAEAEASFLWPQATLHALVSIGTGKLPTNIGGVPQNHWIGSVLVKDIVAIVSDSENVHREMSRRFNNSSTSYFRFNPMLDLDEFPLDLSNRKKIKDISQKTRRYLQTYETSTLMKKLAEIWAPNLPKHKAPTESEVQVTAPSLLAAEPAKPHPPLPLHQTQPSFLRPQLSRQNEPESLLPVAASNAVPLDHSLQVECPLCGQLIPQEEVEVHASFCSDSATLDATPVQVHPGRGFNTQDTRSELNKKSVQYSTLVEKLENSSRTLSTTVVNLQNLICGSAARQAIIQQKTSTLRQCIDEFNTIKRSAEDKQQKWQQQWQRILERVALNERTELRDLQTDLQVLDELLEPLANTVHRSEVLYEQIMKAHESVSEEVKHIPLQCSESPLLSLPLPHQGSKMPGPAADKPVSSPVLPRLSPVQYPPTRQTATAVSQSVLPPAVHARQQNGQFPLTNTFTSILPPPPAVQTIKQGIPNPQLFQSAPAPPLLSSLQPPGTPPFRALAEPTPPVVPQQPPSPLPQPPPQFRNSGPANTPVQVPVPPAPVLITHTSTHTHNTRIHARTRTGTAAAATTTTTTTTTATTAPTSPVQQASHVTAAPATRSTAHAIGRRSGATPITAQHPSSSPQVLPATPRSSSTHLCNPDTQVSTITHHHTPVTATGFSANTTTPQTSMPLTLPAHKTN